MKLYKQWWKLLLLKKMKKYAVKVVESPVNFNADVTFYAVPHGTKMTSIYKFEDLAGGELEEVEKLMEEAG